MIVACPLTPYALVSGPGVGVQGSEGGGVGEGQQRTMRAEPSQMECQRGMFDLPPEDELDAPSYFDGAGRSPLLRCAHAAGMAAIS